MANVNIMTDFGRRKGRVMRIKCIRGRELERKGEQSFKREGEPKRTGLRLMTVKLTGERERMYCRGNKTDEGKERRLRGKVWGKKDEREEGDAKHATVFYNSGGNFCLQYTN